MGLVDGLAGPAVIRHQPKLRIRTESVADHWREVGAFLREAMVEHKEGLHSWPTIKAKDHLKANRRAAAPEKVPMRLQRLSSQ